MRVRRVAAVALALVALSGGLAVDVEPVSAAGKSASRSSRWSDIQKKIRDTRTRIRQAKARERGIIAQINASDLRRRKLEEALAALGVELADASSRLDLLESAAGRAQMELDDRTRELENAIALLEEQQRIMNSRAIERYMNGPASLTPVLLNAEDFSSFVSADEYVESVLDADLNIVEQVRSMRDDVALERKRLNDRKKLIDAQVLTVAGERDRIAALRAKQAKARRQVVGEIGYRKALLERVRDEREAYEEALRSYLRESDAITGLLREYQKGQRVLQGAGRGYLVWPVSGRVSSPYGERVHPIYRRRSFHTGIDIAAPSGTKVGAARAGRVVYVGYKGAFGLIVLVDHGDSVATMYAHLSKTYVRNGAKVKRGASLGAVGCTGWCTGPHLHWEVRLAGNPTNPRRWV